MLKTPLCDIFGIEVPIILAPMGTCTSAELAAAVSNEGGLGGIGTLFRSVTAVKRDIDTVRTLTSKPFAVNHIPQNLDAEAFAYTLQARPPVISFTLADPVDLVKQAHDVGALVMVQVTTVAQAVLAAERGVDVISAQGGESGGYCGEVSTMALVPQVVDAVSPIPVVASGGIYDGRGIAAALMLGAAGVNLGTRFIASKEAPAPIEWKQAITKAESEDAKRFDVRQAEERGCPIDLEDVIYFGARDAVVCSKQRSWLVRAGLRLFTLMFRNSVRAVDLFKIPPEKFVEIGRQIEI
jgi:enoyl-[acyl-carrier protein] reductase II